jgi:hypothetical protein
MVRPTCGGEGEKGLVFKSVQLSIMKYNLEQLWAAYNADEKAVRFLFFWGHTPSKDGKITKSVFSQWWAQPFEADGVSYATGEHYMMAGKARLFGDEATVAEILGAATPKEAKELGRKIANFDGELWNAHKYEIVRKGNFHKFSAHKELAEFLCNTNAHILVEASPVDTIWGIGLKGEDEKAQNPNLWRGENLLGFALMEVRDALLGA